MNPSADAPEVLVRVEGGLGRITLNRPRALNALSHGMVCRIDDALVDWAADQRIRGVVLDGAGGRGLCAGGDVRAVYHDIRDSRAAGRAGQAWRFWRDEYRMNARIARLGKPYLALMDGLVMGGGVGVSAHGSLRVVTERTALAMPEVGIGFVPDVGTGWLLSRAPGELGTWLALTGSTVTGADALACGLADHYLDSAVLPKLLAALTGGAGAERPDPGRLVAELATVAPESWLLAQRDWIDACFAVDTVEEVLERLAHRAEPAAAETARVLATRSPTALKVTLRALRSARGLDSLPAVLEQEYRISCAALDSPDFVEGVRAQLVDKDRNPRWSPPSLAEVDEALVARFFAPTPYGGLGLV